LRTPKPLPVVPHLRMANLQVHGLEVGGLGVSRSQAVGLLLASVARTVVGMAFIFLALSLVPQRPDASIVLPVLMVVFGIIGYGWFFAHQVKKVTHARYPAVRSVEALILVATMFLAVFAVVYGIISAQVPGSFTEPLDHFTAYYFALTVLATVGFGDITPVGDGARIACMVQMALDIAFIGAAVKILGGTAQRAMRARAVNGTSETATG
jgi:voltage-gated potassium channel